MSNRYKGAIISATPPTTTGGESGTASGAWTLEQQMQLTAASLWPIQPLPKFIEDVFSCFLYTGTSANQTITNNIDLSTKGGLVWIKGRNNVESHSLWDTARGVSAGLQSNATSAQYPDAVSLTAYNSNGFSLGTDVNVGWVNRSPDNYVSWTFRKQPKFFDVVTYTGNGAGVRTISHSLGSVPGCLILKRTDGSTPYGDWYVQHRSISATNYLRLNSTAAQTGSPDAWNSTYAGSTVFTVGPDNNQSGFTYAVYLVAHDAGGFGLFGTDNVISCGSYTGDGVSNGPSINLGYEAQYVLIKRTDAAANWHCQDNMRGMSQTETSLLFPNLSNAENTGSLWVSPTATGFKINTASSGFNASGGTYVYIAIRRGPMKVPTLGTSVFDVVTRTATNPNLFATALIYADAAFNRNLGTAQTQVSNRLAGLSYMHTASTSAEVTPAAGQIQYDFNFKVNPYWWSLSAEVDWIFRRAPSVFDVVCYTGDSTARTLTHNLTVVPELMIVKNRTNNNGNQNWQVYVSALGNTSRLQLNTTDSVFTGTSIWNSTSPTASVFSLGTSAFVNGSTDTYVAYLFATCAGVSKVGTYTGNAGYTVTVPCGFTAGVRFVLIKRTDSTGDWYVWDSARGIIAGNDPYLLLNSTAAEVTSTDYIDTYSAGFEVTSTAPAGLNATGGTYIFLAIA